MPISRFIEKEFWLVIAIAALAGLLLPGVSEFTTTYLMPYLRYMVMGILFTVFIRTDVIEMFRHIKNPGFLAYICLCFLIITPAILYLLVRPFGTDIATAVLIVSSMPAGASAGTLARLVGGNGALGASLTIITSLLAPLTVPTLLGWLTGTSVGIDRLSLFGSIATTLFVPMVVSQIVLKWLKPLGEYLKPRASSLNILILFFVTFTPIAANQALLREKPSALIGQTAIMFLAFILLHVIGYFIAPHRSKADRLALATSVAYMNLGLAVVVAANYYPPAVLVAVVLAHLPWSALLKPFKTIAERV